LVVVVVERALKRDDVSREGLGGLHNVAGGFGFFCALGLGGGRIGTGFGGSRP
jgi:hypothetical protein